MPRVKLFDQEDATKKAMELFWEKGYEATSLSDLTNHLRIGKGSFYATFKSKENLFNHCIAKYTESNLPILDKALTTEAAYKYAIEKLLVAYVEGLLSDEKHKGCFMANSCSLIHGENKEVGNKIAEHYARIEKFLEDFLVKNGVSKTKAISVSSTIITFLIGASQQSKINQDKSTYLSTVRNIVGLLD